MVMANHQSFYDIPGLILAVTGRMTFVAKTELFRMPVFGRAMTTAGIVRVDRKVFPTPQASRACAAPCRR